MVNVCLICNQQPCLSFVGQEWQGLVRVETEFDTGSWDSGKFRLIGIQVHIQFLTFHNAGALDDRHIAGDNGGVGFDIHRHAVTGNGL